MGKPWSLLNDAVSWSDDEPFLDLGSILIIWRPSPTSTWEEEFARLRADEPDLLSAIAKDMAVGSEGAVILHGNGLVAPESFATLAAAVMRGKEQIRVRFDLAGS